MTTQQKLPLGQLLITGNAKRTVHLPDALKALIRHEKCDFGDLCEEDLAANMEALETGDRILSAYNDRNGVRFWIITEWDRSSTTILLPEDY